MHDRALCSSLRGLVSEVQGPVEQHAFRVVILLRLSWLSNVFESALHIIFVGIACRFSFCAMPSLCALGCLSSGHFLL